MGFVDTVRSCVVCEKPEGEVVFGGPQSIKCRKCIQDDNYVKRRDSGKNARYAREKRARDKKAVVDRYGGRCVCCGESELVFLTVDHVNKDGAAKRATGELPNSLYRLLATAEVSEDYRILCFNCNFAEFWGGCPHAA